MQHFVYSAFSALTMLVDIGKNIRIVKIEDDVPAWLSVWSLYTVKIIRTLTVILYSVASFPCFNRTGSIYAFVHKSTE